MVEDIVRSLGYLCLGSRLKRTGERIQAQTQQMIDEWDLPVQASQYPLLAAIDRLGPLTIGELADATGVSQPGVTRTLAQLADIGLIEITQPHDDQRRKSIELTKSGRELMTISKCKLWPLIEAAVVGLCGENPARLLDHIALIEDGLAAAPLRSRTRGRAAGKRK